jgi:hypothetical protein
MTPGYTPPPWRTVCVSSDAAQPRRAAQFYKFLPSLVLSGYRHTVWIDGNIGFRDPAMPLRALAYVNSSGFAVFRHPERDCIYAEVAYCADWPKYRTQPLLAQVAAYRARGYPARAGLYACGVIARDSKNPAVQRLGAEWLREALSWSYQDQLSFAFVLWRAQLRPGLFPYELWENPWIAFGPHRTISHMSDEPRARDD